MATGDRTDVFARIRQLMPPWFGHGETPILDAVLTGPAAALSWAYGLIQYARAQTRLLSVSGQWLDIAAWDFFGPALQRRPGQSDATLLARIRSRLFRPAVTREALIAALEGVTGQTPAVFEPGRPADTGAYGAAGRMGYGVAGRYGSLRHPYQVFVAARRPFSVGIPYVSGYGKPAGGYGVPSRLAYSRLSQMAIDIIDADIIEAIESTRPAGYIIWLRITN